MTKRSKQKLNSVFSITNMILMTLQSFMPGFFLLLPANVHAAEVQDETIEVVVETVSEEVEVIEEDNTEYVLEVEEEVKIEVLEVTPTEELATPIEEETETPVVETVEEIKVVEEITEPVAGPAPKVVITTEEKVIAAEEVTWTIDGNTAVVDTVELGVVYIAPQNGEVQVVFTKLPENSGSLTIEEIELSDEVVEQVGAYSNVAYDITSDMADGTFEYELKLPLPEGADDNAGLVYAESVEELNSAVAVDGEVIEDGKVVAAGLDHFTVFIITDDQATYSAPWVDYATQGYLNTGVHYPTNVNPGETATWNFSSVTPGVYKVYVSWSTHPNRTTSAPYDLTHTAGVEQKDINQEQLADQSTIGTSAQWSNWYYYGEYSLDGSSNLVLTGVTNTSGSDYVIADEVLLANVAIAPNIVWVDDDYALNLNNDSHVWGYDAFDSIQDAVDQVQDSGIVHVKEGNYQEQVIITKNLDLLGENNPHLVSVASPVSYKLAESTKTFEPIIFAYGGTLVSDTVSGPEQINVVVDGFNIDGDDRLTSGGNRSVAVLARNINGGINNNTIHNMSIGSSETFGVVIYGDSDVRVGENSISEYSRGGISISGDNDSAPDPIAVVINNQVFGPGDNPNVVWAPNGIQVGYGSTGIVENNTVTGNGWPGPEWSGTGILIVDTSDVVVQSNLVQDNEQAIGVVDFPESLYGPVWSGIVLNIDVLDNTVTSNSWGLEISNEVSDVLVSGNYFSNIENDAIDVYTYGASVTPPTGIVIKSNNIESAGLDGLWVGDTVTDTVEAGKNWWGDVSGPSGDGPGSGQTVIGNANYCPWLTNSDLNNPAYGGSCLGYLQGRTFIDQADNGLLLTADNDYPDGMEDGFAVRAYDSGWNLIEEQTTNTTGKVGQYNFASLLDEGNVYRVCGVQRDGYLESVSSIGQHVVDTNGGTIPSQYSDAVIVANGSVATDEFSRCWETTLSDDNGAYLGIGYKISAPTQTGYNVDDGDAYETPRDPNELACIGGVTNINGVSVHWTDVGDGNTDVKYQRQYRVGAGSWSGNEIYTNPYTNYRTFGGGGGNEGTYGSRVRAWVDTNNNSVVDADEAVSDWSNACEVTYDTTVPAVPTGLRRLAREDHNIVFACGDSAQIRHMHPDWDDNSDPDFSHYEYSSFNGISIGIDERRFDESIFEYNGSWLPNEGTYGFAVRAVDNAGNKSAWAVGGTETLADSCQITYDDTAPDATIDSIKYSDGTVEPTKFVTNYSTPTILGTTSSDATSVALTVNGNTYSAIVSGTDWEVDITDVLPEGTQNMVVVATDHVGNITTIDRDIFIDTNAPTAVHTFYKDGVAVTDPIAYGQTLGQFTFTGEYLDVDPSSNLYWDSYVIFEAQDDHSFRFSQNGKKAYCGWRSTPNLVDMTSAMSSTFSLTTPTAFTNCVSTIEDGEYYMAHHIYDTATRKDIPSINQFRDVLGLHFIIDTEDPSSIITTFDLEDDGKTQTATFSGLIQGTATDEPVDTASGVAEVLLEIMHTPFGATESSYWNGSNWQTPMATVSATGTTTWEYQITPEESVFEGTYVVSSHAVDNAGNMESTYTITIVYDKTIPEVILTIDPTDPDGKNAWYVTEPTVTLTANDNYNVDYIEYQWNSTVGTWTTYTAPINPPGEGQNVLYYRSVDVVGNVSDLGVKEVKFDKTAPTEGAGNLKVRNIRSTTAEASWDKPENSSEIEKFVLIWKHEDGKTRSDSVSGDTYEFDLYDLFDGEWELTLESQDDAGHAYSVTEKFTVGGSSGDVLGTTDEAVTSGFIASVSNFINDALDSKDETKNSDSETKSEESNNDSGSVLGDSDSSCSTWQYYLPLFLLLIQLMFAVSLEIANRELGKKKLIMALGASALVIGAFYILKNAACYGYTTGLIQTLSKWFVPLSLVLAAILRLMGSMTVEEK